MATFRLVSKPAPGGRGRTRPWRVPAVSECVCEGLRGVFEFVGGVPRRAVFDNATEVGRGVGSETRASEMFRRFAARYGPGHSLANPCPGNERGSVENMVGTHRRDTFVPVPQFGDVRASDERLPRDGMDQSDKRHYRLGVPQLELFGDDREALPPLPPQAFSCVRWERRTRRCNKQGDVATGGVHRHDVGPALARSEVDVGPGSAWAEFEPYGGPCPTHLGRAQCSGCPHDGECDPGPSTLEMLVGIYLQMTGRRPVPEDAGGEPRIGF